MQKLSPSLFIVCLFTMPLSQKLEAVSTSNKIFYPERLDGFDNNPWDPREVPNNPWDPRELHNSPWLPREVPNNPWDPREVPNSP